MDQLLTISESAHRLKIGVSTLRRYLRRRLLPKVVLPGGDQRIREQDLDDFISTRLVGAINLELSPRNEPRGPKCEGHRP